MILGIFENGITGFWCKTIFLWRKMVRKLLRVVFSITTNRSNRSG